MKKGLAEGTIDVVVGTHAVLAKGVSFKRLGLVVVDEEQRFVTAMGLTTAPHWLVRQLQASLIEYGWPALPTKSALALSLMARLDHLPVIVDPSHAAGRRFVSGQPRSPACRADWRR